MRNKTRGPGKCRAFSPFKKTTAVLAVIFFLAAMAVPAAVRSYEEKPIEQERSQPQKLVITTPKPCTKGSLTIYGQGEVQYQYSGEIQLVNDGKNGEDIEVIVEYPDDWEPQCSCFSEEDAK